MSITESIQDIIGKYSVTGVLRERLELETRHFEIQLGALSEKVAQKDALLAEQAITIAKLSSENEALRTNLEKAEAEIQQFRSTPKPFTPTRVEVGEDW